MNCPNIKRAAISPGNGQPINNCNLVSGECGRQNVWIPASRCERECSRKDDGKSHASKAIVGMLKRRVVLDWEREPCATCGGSAISVEDAMVKLKARVGAEATEDVLVQAVENGMPIEEATRLAGSVLSEML